MPRSSSAALIAASRRPPSAGSWSATCRATASRAPSTTAASPSLSALQATDDRGAGRERLGAFGDDGGRAVDDGEDGVEGRVVRPRDQALRGEHLDQLDQVLLDVSARVGDHPDRDAELLAALDQHLLALHGRRHLGELAGQAAAQVEQPALRLEVGDDDLGRPGAGEHRDRDLERHLVVGTGRLSTRIRSTASSPSAARSASAMSRATRRWG